MQGKGIVKFFLVVMILVCLMQFMFILPTRSVEKDAKEHASLIAQNYPADQQKKISKQAETAYLDSMSTETIFSIPLLKKYTYEDLKRQQLALGLDLKGGMSVVLQVDLKEFIRALANNSKDPTFESALEKASQDLKSAQEDYVTLFADAFQEVGQGKKLAPIFSRNESFRDVITFETSNGEVVRMIREKADETVDLTFKMLKDRIDELGVVQPNISLDAGRDLILVELPGIENPERARSMLVSTANLEFWNVYRATDAGIINSFVEADKKLKSLNAGEEVESEPTVRLDTTWAFVNDSLGNVVDSTMNVTEIPIAGDPLNSGGPLLSKLTINAVSAGQITMPYPVLGMAKKNEMPSITEALKRPQIKALFPKDLEFRWSQKPTSYGEDEATNADNQFYELYAIKKKRSSGAPLEGDLVTDASTNPDPTSGEVTVSLKMNTKGAKIWGDMTTKAAQDNNREIAIVLDDKVVSAPSVRNAILSGDSQITGNFDVQEAKDLASILQIGKLPAKPKIIQEALVGPSLGQDNINRSMKSLIIGFIMVLLFMVYYYGRGGIVSIIALLMNLFFIFGALASYGTVLTLPGFAGVLLTIGMAVDANVIIYERIREELRNGKAMAMAVKDGFQHSYSAIIDANVTTILVAFVLAYFGMGPIKGFAIILIIGVLCSLFTAVLVGRLIIDSWMGRDGEMSFWTGSSKNLFSNMTTDWLGRRKMAYMMSGAFILLGIISMFVRGWDLGVDFKGGYSYNVQFEEGLSIDQEELRASLTKAFENNQPVVKAVSTANTYNVVSSYMIDDDADDAADKVMAKLFEGVNAVAGGNLALAKFRDADGSGTHITTSSKVGPTIADDIKTSSVYATIFALLLIFLYIFIRFNKWQYSMGAVAALFHDVLVVLSVFSIFHGILPFSMEVDQAFIAAILTVIGYSINDTVVVFDRVREFINAYTKKGKTEVINMAINSTVSRTVITSLTTLFVVLILFLFGGTSIKGFSFALLVGILVGTYSSIFIATPIMHDLTDEVVAKESTTKKSSFSRAKA